ncbi:histidine kinase with GAF domain [Xenococcus sp. PCC 7305]|uniref:sensor histidine kinase n=1 Tax=Xenococcus sp. PCC 7305 TaxID=102125 RepID=UPI0002ABBBFB|nr:GAF domain-containing protein [Xenococcus sp. PCC 7305]ELS02458.1 histidine kinase with GAF domain [Xenococcus sp. PCC 7305]
MSNSDSQVAQESLSLQAQGDKLVAAIALRIRQSLELDLILNQTVEEVRQFLKTDRVLVYRFEPDWSGLVVVESVVDSCKAVFGSRIKDPCFSENHIQKYRQGKIQIVEDIYNSNLTPCHAEMLASFEVKANLVLPIVAENQLWGLLIAQHCLSPRKWDLSEVSLLKQLTTQVGIAVQQAELYQKVQSLNEYLELKVQKRTAKLERSFKFESLIRNITEKIRDTLDETQILQTVTQEVREVLKIDRCKIELYDHQQKIGTIVYECSLNEPSCQGITRKIADFPELYQQLLQKQSLQFVEKVPELSPKKLHCTRLVCPIFDNRGVLGNLWLLRPPQEMFDELEVRLVEQIANQCAIAIRQARLYKNTQSQVEELGKLNNLKDNFLKTISHELRTPMSSILIASQTLEKLIQAKGNQGIQSQNFQRVFDIFKNSCQKQNKLVNDLLTLCYVDADSATLIPEWIDLNLLIPKLAESFKEQIQNQQQQLIISDSGTISLINSDITLLERVINELLTNACKYTPAEGKISIATWAEETTVCFSISNSGVEISPQEQKLIFDKFYRIPTLDPWRYGGTGIGLALVKKLVALLGAELQLESRDNMTTFTMRLPIKM